jgi:hypothetical protein
VELPNVYDSNGYGAAINAQGDAARFRQLELWIRLAAGLSFSDIESQDEQSRLRFRDAAQVFASAHQPDHRRLS